MRDFSPLLFPISLSSKSPSSFLLQFVSRMAIALLEIGDSRASSPAIEVGDMRWKWFFVRGLRAEYVLSILKQSKQLSMSKYGLLAVLEDGWRSGRQKFGRLLSHSLQSKCKMEKERIKAAMAMVDGAKSTERGSVQCETFRRFIKAMIVMNGAKCKLRRRVCCDGYLPKI